MTILNIYKNNDKVLREKCKKITEFNDKERELFDSLLQTMYSSKGIGLAASQIGVLSQMLVIDIGSGPLKLANPKIIKKKGKTSMEEGCLSLPNLFVQVKRAKEITVEAQDEFGKFIKIDATELLARAIQHEIDHLKGVLIIDYLPWLKRLLIKRKLAQKAS